MACHRSGRGHDRARRPEGARLPPPGELIPLESPTATDTEDEQIWYRIDLDDEQVAALIEEYSGQRWRQQQLPWYRCASWYDRVRWPLVISAIEEVLQRDAAASPSRLSEQLRPVERKLPKVDRQGMGSLLLFPLQIFRAQLYVGGHRSVAMRSQGVRFVPGMCGRGDVAAGAVDAGQVYPIEGGGLTAS